MHPHFPFLDRFRKCSFIDLALRGRDPLGKVIALVLLTIFLLTLVTLCLRIFSNSCSGSRRCCVVQCAVQVQCCCQWKAGRLRILPSGAGGTRAGSAVAELHVAGAADDARGNRGAGRGSQQQQQARRANLFPPPPPAYVEIFPEGEIRAGLNNCQWNSNRTHRLHFLITEEVPRHDPQQGDGEIQTGIVNSSSGGDAPIRTPIDFDDHDGEVGREGSAATSSTSQAESVEIRFEEPEVIAGDTGANRDEDIPVDVGGNFG